MSVCVVGRNLPRKLIVWGRALALSLVMLTSATAAEPGGERSPQQWLEKMSSALQEVNYQGVFVYRRDRDMAAMKVTHVVDSEREYELLETLTGEPRREIRNTAHSVSVEGQSPLAGIDRYYELQLVALDRVAGRPAQLLTVEPRDEYRYGYRLWLDQDTGLLLRSELLSVDDSLLEQVMFTSLDLLSAAQGQALLAEQGRLPLAQGSDTETLPLVWDIPQLPPGFKLQDHRIKQKSPTQSFEHMVFSDGLASVSVFIEDNPGEGEAFQGLSTMGAVNAYGDRRAGIQFTVVGEVPRATVRAIGESIRKKDAVASE